MNVLFDLDGTLTNPREGIVTCIQHALGELGEPVPEAAGLERLIGPPLRDAFAELLPVGTPPERIEEAIAAFRERFGDLGLFENVVYDGIPEVLESLSARGACLFIATSKPRVFAERILDHFQLSIRFDAVYGAELDGLRSDKSELIAHVLSSSGLLAEDTIMVGDRLHDVKGALSNGVFPTGVLWGYGSKEELTAAGAKRLFERPAELDQLSGAR